MAKDQPERYRLSSIDLLPVEADEDVAWAERELGKKRRTDDDIWDAFNLRLKVKGLGPISRAAFGRKAIRVKRIATRLGEVREIASVLATRFEDGTDESLTILLAETIKTMIFEALENAGSIQATPMAAEMMANLAGAAKSAQQTLKIAADTKKVTQDNFVKKTDEVLDKVAEIKGLSAEAKAAMRRELFGLIDVQ